MESYWRTQLMQYFVKRGDKVQGPFSREKLVRFAKAKKISGSDFVATDKLGPFDPLKTIWHSITGIKGKSPIGTIQQPSPPQAQEPVVAAMPRPAAVPAPSNLSSANPNTRKKMTSQNPDNSGFQNPPPTPPQHQQNKFCATCGNSILMQAEICPKCGVRQPVMQGGFGSSGTKRSVSGGFQTNGNVASDNEIRTAVQNMNTSHKEYYQEKFTELRDNGESFKATWNWYSFLFGVVWYAVAGLWVKCAIMLLACIVLAGVPAPFFWIYCGVAGNYDLYLKKVKNKDLW